jgi:hypothetical protein
MAIKRKARSSSYREFKRIVNKAMNSPIGKALGRKAVEKIKRL